MKGWLKLAALSAACGAAPSLHAPLTVRPGIEVLLSDSIQLVRGKGVGLLSNLAGVDARGVSDVDRLLQSGTRLLALFSPEHGFRGEAAPGAPVASTRDSATGLPIYSLYGESREPTDAMLSGIAVLLVDLPDVGARYFTYLSKTIDVMRAAARHRIPVVLLDRPNPIGGAVQGNVLDTVFRSAVGILPMPMRPGMTLGELARLANADLQLGAELHVIPAAGWRREQTLLETGLPFVPPSPNLKQPESLFHYPGTCLFEATALSVGRGSDAPFSQIGAPWLDPDRVIGALPPLPGVRFRPVRFTPVKPGDDKYPGREVRGIRLELTDPARYDPTAVAVTLLSVIHGLYPDSLGVHPARFDRLAGDSSLRLSILAGTPPATIVAGWAPARDGWQRHREFALLYR